MLKTSRGYVQPVTTLDACRDPKDNCVLEAAVDGKAEIIVTGDDDLLVLSPFRSIEIISLAKLVARLARK